MLFNQTTVDRVKTEKWPAVSRYLDELLIQKCQFRGRFNVSIFSLERLSPKGSCHLDESSMNHTLAQKHLCEFWCGMHLTVLRAKTLQLNLTGAIEWSEVRNLRLKFGWHLTVQLNNNRKHSMTCPPAATWMRPGATLQVQKFASKLPSSWFP